MARNLLERTIACRRALLATKWRPVPSDAAKVSADRVEEVSTHPAEPAVTKAMLDAAEDAMGAGLGLRGIIVAALKAQRED